MTDLDLLARDYVDLTLTKHQYHDKWDVYWFADTPFWKRTELYVDREKPVYPYKPAPNMSFMTLKAILGEAKELYNKLIAMHNTQEGNEAIRLEFLIEHAKALVVRTRLLCGEKMSYDAYTADMFGLIAPQLDDAELDQALEQLDAALPGSGDIASRIELFKQAITVAEDKVPTVMNAAAKFFHDIAVKHMSVKDCNMPRIRYKKMSTMYDFVTILYGYDYDIIALEQNFNLNVPYFLDNLPEVAGHELEPGHFTFMNLRTKGAVDTCYPELGLNSHCPSSALIEGGARAAIELSLDTPDKVRALDEELFALAGAEQQLIDCLPAWRKFAKISNYGKLKIERNLWDGVWTQEQANKFAESKCIDLADVKRFENDAGHFTSHAYSTDVLLGYYNKRFNTKEEKWAAYTRLCQYPFVMSGLVDGTFDPFEFQI